MSTVIRNKKQEVEIQEKCKVLLSKHPKMLEPIFLVLTLWSRASQAVRKKEEGEEERIKDNY